MATKARKSISSKLKATPSKNRAQRSARKVKPKAAQKTTSTKRRVWDYIKKNKLQDNIKR